MDNKFQSFWRQTRVLTSRYFRICLNNKQSLLLNFAIPVLTILIVCSVACDGMFGEEASVDYSVNGGFPVLDWEAVPQENDGKLPVVDSGVGEINGDTAIYFILPENNNYELQNTSILLKNKDGEEIATYSGGDIEIVSQENNGTYSVYVKSDELSSNETYSISLLTDTYSDSDLENQMIVEVPRELEDIDSKVTETGNAYGTTDDWELEGDFDIDSYAYKNQESLAMVPEKTTSINNEKYIIIDSAETFAYIFSKHFDGNDKNYYLTCDLELNGYENLVPLGKDSDYEGVFDGNGHTISNFSSSDHGLIASLSGIVKNLGVKNSDVDTSESHPVGIIADEVNGTGKIYNSFVKDCSVSASQSAGAVAGEVAENSSNAEIYCSYTVNCSVSSDDSAGGIVGSAGKGKVRACYAVPETVSGYLSKTGAIAGSVDSEGVIENCFYPDNTGLDAYGSDSTVYYDDGTSELNEEEIKNCSEKLKYSVDGEDKYYFKKDGQLDEFKDTQTGLFMLVCVAIFVGICNSIQEVCKERNILKREYMTNLNLGSYVSSKLIVQALLCAIQIFMVLAIFAMFISGKQVSSSGAIFGSIWIEYFITMFLLCFASDTLALFISSIVKSSSTANIFIPIVLIVQIVFSGVLFDLGSMFEKIAYLMFSKWGIAGLAITSHLNNARSQFLLDNSAFELQLGPNMSTVDSMFTSEAGNLLTVWAVLIMFTAVLAVASGFVLRRIKKDKR